MPDILFADLETFSEADLKKVGSYRYAEDPTTEIMLFPYAIDDGPEKCYDATTGEPPPRELLRALRKCATGKMKLVGQNFLMFDRQVLKNAWGIDIPPKHIIDTMVLAYRNSLPGSLEALCEVLGIPQDLAKDKAGKALIQRFCKPTPKNYKIRRYTADTHPEEWKRFVSYGKSDITSMREVFYRLPSWNDTAIENEILCVDQAMNDRGFFVDQDLAFAAIQADQQHKEEVKTLARKKYGCSVTGKGFLPALKKVAGPAFYIPNAQKATMTDLLNDPDFPDDGKELITMRLEAASTAATKYNPLLNGLSADGRRKGTVQYGGAKRTLRWAGRKFQPQNLARGFYSCESPEEIATFEKALKALKKGYAKKIYNIGQLVVSAVRPCIIPAPGKKLAVADYSNVEGRGLAWVAGEISALTTFRAGLDIYCQTAGKMFGMDPDYIKANRKDLRQIGKACELGLGYQGGVSAFLQFAKTLGLDLFEMAETMDGTFPDHIWASARRGYEWARIQEKNKKPKPGEEKANRPAYDLPKKVWMTCDSIKRMWREAHPETVRLWDDVQTAVIRAIKNPGKSYWAGADVRENGDRAIRVVRTVKNGNPGWWLKIELPSGRFLSYPGIGLSASRNEETGEEETRIKYMGENQTTGKWGWQYSYGGKFVENIIQALCRDIMAWCMPEVEKAGYPIIMTVHDELITEVPDTDEYSAEELCELMCEIRPWFRGFPLKAEGDIMYFYRK